MKSKKITLGLLVFYLVALTWIILFKLQFSIADLPHLRNINLIPFADSVIVNGTIDFSDGIYSIRFICPYFVGEKAYIKTISTYCMYQFSI